MDPLSAVTTVAAAVGSVGAWVGRSVEGTSFAAVLAETDAAAAEAPAASLTELREGLQEAVDQVLTALGVRSPGPLEMTVAADGQIRLQSDHPRGAEIEAALAASGDVGAWAARLGQAAGAPMTIAWPSLTSPLGFPYTMR